MMTFVYLPFLSNLSMVKAEPALPKWSPTRLGLMGGGKVMPAPGDKIKLKGRVSLLLCELHEGDIRQAFSKELLLPCYHVFSRQVQTVLAANY
jgi:hypothetical protein